MVADSRLPARALVLRSSLLDIA